MLQKGNLMESVLSVKSITEAAQMDDNLRNLSSIKLQSVMSAVLFSLLSGLY